ncbi:methylmalonyl-CoA mutase family protein [Kibdelosporangium phytohabitans]|uniref:Methylmalonyl-CoA mutase n=1 Tax=Kibdelosporangium phytohabitans TaxID=860235 RepID=A0A0N7F5A4_9PSEU|nr:methylmalonyl-CoA mutase family protein [Kibdelosporangium phytohabitans]ALG13679.1 methylmalonyl-CoA mutase [Kibdelosporangium phytohabitans]MBE1465566.1 methylmalonyl-CoA mutase [Kibdelosporangium phytohabitans]
MSQAPEQEELVLAAQFPTPQLAQWQELVAGVLRKSGRLPVGFDGDAAEKIATKTYDDILVHPLYTRQDAAPAAGMPGLPPFVRASRPEGAVTTGWDVRQRHAHPDPATAKKSVLTDLEHGVTSLWLVVGDAGLPIGALEDVLDEVYIDLAPVVLDAGAGFLEAADALLEVHSDKAIPASEVGGNLGADPIGLRARTGADQDLDGAIQLAVRVSGEFPRLRTLVADALPFHQAGGSDSQELGLSIATGVAYLRALTAAGLSVEKAAEQLEFRYAATADQFSTIAKLRAARRLWGRVLEVSGAPTVPQRQHAVTSPVMMTRRDPWVNMLRTTLACFAAGVGGADSVTVLPFDDAIGLPDNFARRIARNTQAVLLEESKVAGVIDPAGGSYYVERLTDDLAHAAWAFFQTIEGAGGLAAALDSGLVEDKLAETWQRRSRNIARRKDPLTGVSEFPNLTEKLPIREQAPAGPSGGLPQVRLAGAYEELRDLADAQPQRPKVFLATLGPVAAHTARGTFAANLFQAGGIETPNAGATSTADEVAEAFAASGTQVACVCGTDALYAERVPDTVEALRTAGAKKILVAGKGEYEGVDGYIHIGCDVLTVLRDTLKALGVGA